MYRQQEDSWTARQEAFLNLSRHDLLAESILFL